MASMKPFQIILMAVFGLIALAGLVLFATFQGFSTGAPQVGTVSIWGTLPSNAMNGALGAVKQGKPEYASVSYVERPEATFDADLAEAIASGRGPDLIILTQEDLIAAQGKLAMVPSSVISERDFRDSYLPISELFLTNGGTFGIPFLVDPLMLYYNRPVLASAGAARPPSTWEAVTGLTTVVNRQTETQTVVRSLIALGTYGNIENARAILSLLFLQAGYRVTERTTAGLESDLTDVKGATYGAKPTESALNFYTEFANPAKTVYSWNRSLPDNRQAFLAGDLALYPGFASERAELSEANPNLDFDMAPMPAPSQSAARITYGRAYAFAVPRASKNSAGAVRVAQILSAKGTVNAFAHALGMAPARRDSLAPSEGDLYEPVYYLEALIASGWLSPMPSETDQIFDTMVSSIATGKASVSNALSTASQSLDAALK
jgi:multiple sugar transport system substrate-binding protein